VLGVVRPKSFLADGCRRDDGSVAVTVPREIDDGEKVAVLAVFVTGPGEEISSRRPFRAIHGWRRMPCAGERGNGSFVPLIRMSSPIFHN
jgi:hypothetical protein